MPDRFLRCLLTLSLGFVGGGPSLVQNCLAQNQDHPVNVASGLASDSPEQPLRLLLVTGGCCHDYPRQAEILAKGMESRLGKVGRTKNTR